MVAWHAQHLLQAVCALPADGLKYYNDAGQTCKQPLDLNLPNNKNHTLTIILTVCGSLTADAVAVSMLAQHCELLVQQHFNVVGVMWSTCFR